ncbi:hypothetical protein [Nonomuraea zeae]|uniref:Uncharacterized protein n=1 Tax=Nonomuraea zeae TaxID=1642303 RepID=A0A5S4GVT3_9ACTN|nr:hypothetical protein [Nonomuraea zeae]TMR37063.1 hypothetical protein ETD85_09010 [Nonomuraea zeae]
MVEHDDAHVHERLYVMWIFGWPETDGAHMHDGQYGSSALIDVSLVSLHNLQEMESAALRAAVASCLSDDKEQMAAFQNSI